MSQGDLAAELIDLIGEAATIALADELAGTRLCVPARVRDDSNIVRLIGKDAAIALSMRYAPDTICVPLMRELRAKHYRSQGASHARIAVRLGMTEKGVQKIFRRANLETDM